MFSRDVAPSCSFAVLFAAAVAAFSAAAALSAAGPAFGPPPGAKLSLEKLAPIADFVNGEIATGRISGANYIVFERAEDMLFVVMQDSPSGRLHGITTIKKIIYDAFEAS